MDRNHHQQAGFTLTESTITTAVLAILLAVAWPSLSELRQAQQVRALMFEISAHLAMTRSAAISRGSAVAMCPSASYDSCDDNNDWTKGWLIYADPDGNRKPDSTHLIIGVRTSSAASRLSIHTSSGREQARYNSLGRTAGSNLTFHICSRGLLKGQVIVNAAGRQRSRLLTAQQQCPF
ncbi:GspH/FimT family pseudopilin [Xanthomonas sp. 4461]|uniref:GspH/FimT family pseudopilin n=1 Tax=Xanthomonas sp. 4461 TaxID=3035313 RepID=UPI0021685CC3|nr:GspH/FimT family pseudopilin [Xanthomonas sp. 4461]